MYYTNNNWLSTLETDIQYVFCKRKHPKWRKIDFTSWQFSGKVSFHNIGMKKIVMNDLIFLVIYLDVPIKIWQEFFWPLDSNLRPLKKNKHWKHHLTIGGLEFLHHISFWWITLLPVTAVTWDFRTI